MGRSLILDVAGQVDRNLTVENTDRIGTQVVDAVLRAVPETRTTEGSANPA